MGRSTDYKALDGYHKLRDANRALIESAKSLEHTDLDAAAKVCYQAIEALKEYATISYEGGIVGQLLAEESAEMGINGELRALDRLSLCLIRLGRAEEAARQADSYFALYKRDLQFAGAARIKKRIERALGKAGDPARQDIGHRAANDADGMGGYWRECGGESRTGPVAGRRGATKRHKSYRKVARQPLGRRTP